LAQLFINGQKISLEGTEACCSPYTPPLINTGVISLSGFGFASVIASTNYNVDFSIRTHVPDGVILTECGTDNSSWSLSFVRGKIQLQSYDSKTNVQYASETAGYYNYGQWVGVSCYEHNKTLICEVTSDDSTDTVIVHAPDLRGVESVQLGDRTEEIDRFAGCLANMTLGNTPVDPWLHISESEGILLYCPDQVGLSSVIIAETSLARWFS